MATKLPAVITDGEIVLYDPALYPTSLFDTTEGGDVDFAARFAKAETVDALFDALKGNTSQNLVGRRLQIMSVRWRLYRADEGWTPMAVCDAADVETGEVLEFATTSGMLTAFIRHVELIDGFPFNTRITETKTRSGQTALNFERV